ncbi:MAG: DUF87 domain-containing protein [Firmicutes bacterium]|nr:DUF87 domain-containing protein [Bacillota bacterium]
MHDADPAVLGEFAPTLHDLMTVIDGIDVRPSEIYVSPSGFTKIYYITGLPSIIQFGYLNRFFRLGADVHVSLHVEPTDSARAISRRTKMMTRLQAEIQQEHQAGTNKQIAFHEQEYALLEREREDLRLGEERMFYVTLMLAVSSPDREEFLQACDRIEREGFTGFLIREAYKEHDIGFRSVAPLGENALRHPIEMTSSALANAFPFTNSRFSHEYGVPIGVDFSSGHLNRYDAWHQQLVNASLVMVGVAGSGKSFLLKGLVARSAAFGVRHVIIDYEGEYTGIVKALGGVSLRIDERSSHRFNPFELEEEEELVDGSVHRFVDVREKIAEMERLIVTMAQLHATDLMDGYTAASINNILQTMYEQDFGFTSDPDSLYDTQDTFVRDGDRLIRRTKRPQPRFSDFYHRLTEASTDDARLQELAMRLRRFQAGGTEGMFDCYSTVELEEVPIVHFDLSSLSEKSLARQLGMQVMIEWTVEKFIKKHVHIKKRVVIDEAQKMLTTPDHAQFLEDVFRRIRKRSGSAVAASQDFGQFARNEHGRAIIQNSATKVLLKQDKNDKVAVMEIFGLEEREFDELMAYRHGQGRWVVGGEVFYNQLEPFADEYNLFTTRFVESEHQLANRQGVML